jgi:hypothetical protein
MIYVGNFDTRRRSDCEGQREFRLRWYFWQFLIVSMNNCINLNMLHCCMLSLLVLIVGTALVDLGSTALDRNAAVAIKVEMLKDSHFYFLRV